MKHDSLKECTRCSSDTCYTQEVTKDINARFLMCKSWNELSIALSERPKNLVFHIDMVRRHGGTISEFMMMLETMMKYTNTKIKPNIGVSIEADTHLSTIKELQKQGIHKAPKIEMDSRDFGIGAQILHDLGITKLKVLSNASTFRKRVGMTGYGIEIIEYVNY